MVIIVISLYIIVVGYTVIIMLKSAMLCVRRLGSPVGSVFALN